MKAMIVIAGGFALACTSMSHAQALLGPEWVEQGDAGGLVETAQPVTGQGQLTKIRGQLTGMTGLAGEGDFEDMYRLRIVTPTQFSITTTQVPQTPEGPTSTGGAASFDTQLWVFDFTGFGLLGNDDVSDEDNRSYMSFFATDNSGVVILEPGTYFICISGQGNRPTATPVDQLGGLQLFNFASPFEVSGPDGPGGEFPVDSWGGAGAIGTYEIALTGCGFVIPGPGTLVMAAAAMACGARRRRRM